MAFSGFSRPIIKDLDDGAHHVVSRTVTCEPIYGFLPCTTEIWGQLFLIVVYQYLLSLGEKYVSHGSDLFFKLTGPGIFGASLFFILGTFPQISLLLVTGLSTSDASAAAQKAAMGMSILAGSAVFKLTLEWGSCVAFGSFDLKDDSPSSEKGCKTQFISLQGSGIITDSDTRSTARIMLVSMIPFMILQLPKILNSTTGTRVAVLISLIITVAFFIAYCIYQIFQPWVQNRRFEYLTQTFVKNKLLRLLYSNGKPNIPLIKEIYNEIDKNHDGSVSASELRLLLIGIQLEADGDLSDAYVDKIMEEFDITGDGHIEKEEFVRVLLKWLTEARNSLAKNDHNPLNIFGKGVESVREEQQSLVHKSKRSPNAKKSLSIYFKAATLLLLGTTTLVLLANPLVKTVVDFATAANISSFFIPYVIIPLTLNVRSAKSAITSARQKTKRAVSLTLSQLYGGVFMNNMISLMVFLSIVYIRDLSWNVSAEVMVVMIICTIMGLFTSSRTEFPLWTSFLAYLLYPISLLMLYVYTSVFGWS